MGTSLTGKQIKNTYKSLIKVSDNTEASASAKQLSDGNGNDFGVYIDTDGVLGLGSAPSYSLDISSRTDGVALPVGTTANRPTASAGLLRYNSTIGKVEFYDTGWKTIFTTSGGTISGSVTITGDLTVQGDNTIIEAQTVEVEDNILNLNRTQGSPDTATATTSGISIYRGDGVTEASFIFDDSDDTWDLTNNLVIAGTLQSSSYTDGTATLTGGTLSGAVLADGVTATTQANTDNSTKIATTAYVKSVVTLEDLDFAGGTGTGSVDLDSQTFTIAGTANEIETSASGQTLTIGLPDDVTITGDLTVDTNTLYVDSTNNRVGIGTVSPNYAFNLSNSNTLTAVYQQFTNGTTGTTATDGTVMGIDSDGDFLINNQEAKEIKLYTSDTLRLGIDSTGNIAMDTNTLYVDAVNNRVGIGTTSAGSKFQVKTGTDNNIAFNIISSGTLNGIQRITSYNDAITSGVPLAINGLDLYFTTGTSNDERMKISSGGDISFRDGSANEAFYWDASAARLGIGTTSPTRQLTVNGTTSSAININSNTTNGLSVLAFGDSDDDNYAQILFANSTNKLQIQNGGGGAISNRGITLDSSENVGIGTSSPSATLDVNGTLFASGRIRATSDGSASQPIIQVGADDDTGFFRPAANNIGFSTAGTERMRITSGGHLKASVTGSYNNPTGTWSEFNDNTANITLQLVNTNASGDGMQVILNSSDTTNYFFNGYSSSASAHRIYIYSNGNIVNSNNSYGALSDVKLKENIVDATPKLDDLMQVKIRNYNLIGEETKQLGVVAQELEEVFPAMVSESPDFENQEVPQLDENGQEVLDENGDVVMTTEKVDLGTTTKSVKYSVFVPMLIKAMQEQQEIIQSQGDLINDLKARIETLENQ